MLALTEQELAELAARAGTAQQLRDELIRRAETMGVPARAVPETLADEAIEDFRVLSSEDLRELARGGIPLPRAVERRMLQSVVDDVSTRLLMDPEEAARWLSPAELTAVADNPNLTTAYFGNAVERSVALELADRPDLARFLHTPQRPGVSTPDIGGPIGRTGPRAYDVTTSSPRAIAAHEARSYAPFTSWITYPSLPPGWRFPPPRP
jgi:hypothetical protein